MDSESLSLRTDVDGDEFSCSECSVRYQLELRSRDSILNAHRFITRHSKKLDSKWPSFCRFGNLSGS
jgi:hypothetical protein